jgi:hypothetical protein
MPQRRLDCQVVTTGIITTARNVPTGRAYSPTHYGMELTSAALTFEAAQANESHDPKTRDRGHRLHSRRDYQLPCDELGRLGGQDGDHVA